MIARPNRTGSATLSAEPKLFHVSCLHPGGLHRVGYWQWGAADNPDVVVCLHGLTRQGRDFDVLAQALAVRFRVVCPDLPGRGESDWLANPGLYQPPQYVADMVTLLARLDAQRLMWVGTSLGGLVGMVLAGLDRSPVERLVLNDIGPHIEPAGLARIAGYVGRVTHFDTVEQAADQLWNISQGFGPHTREEWLALTRPMLRADGDGWKLHYDPAISQPMTPAAVQALAAAESAMWAAYDAIRARTLLLRGAESDILSRETAQAMRERGPRAQVREFAGVGHAPTLVHADQVQVVVDFLTAA